ncbi:serine carboxypeptidase 49-like protein, partial [Trifolium pratense]
MASTITTTSFSILLLVALVLFLQSPPPSSATTFNNDIANHLIKSFNLFPPHDINIISDPNVRPADNNNKIVEKPLRFPNFSGEGEGISIDDLAHRAGYYPIQHSHAA